MKKAGKHQKRCIQKSTTSPQEERLEESGPQKQMEQNPVERATEYMMRGEYRLVQSYLENNRFYRSDWHALNLIWIDSQRQMRKLARMDYKKVEWHRFKKKNPPPLTISDGKDKYKYNMPLSAKKILEDFFSTTPNPSHEEKKLLAQNTCLTDEQIKNWFKNKRQRIKKNEKRNLLENRKSGIYSDETNQEAIR
ncbi:homeobox protein SIX6-like [Octopus sinensis]|uniref:Homeobox protein SIX6-like n=1 Tax=Octopus sinensis TaxID=2607531 RepID=A0A6P7U0N7_9MOLL|nr:homeobox protein SIX6-like [Octopus sinensis]